jgi:hypothetical protein
VGNSLFLSPETNRDTPLVQLYRCLKADPDDPAKILANTTLDDCRFYNINPPVLAKGNIPKVVETCLDASNNWLQADKIALVEELVSDEEYLTGKYVCFVIEPPQGETLLAFWRIAH